MKMKFHTMLIASLLLVCAGFLSGCSSSPDSRIRRNQDLFNTLPSDAQASIRAGQVRVGFTPDMVRLALGEPSRRYTRTTQTGSSDVWAYAGRSSSTSVSFGLGMGMGGRGPGIGTGIGIGTTMGAGDRASDTARIVFDNGKVTSIESASGR